MEREREVEAEGEQPSRQKRQAIRSFTDKLRSKTEPTDYFYSNLYAPGASSIEEEDDVASGILKRRRERAQIAQLHGSSPPSNKNSALVNLLGIMGDLLRVQKRLLDIEKSKIERGFVFGYTFTITATSVVHLDFLDSAGHENLPTGVSVNSPGTPLFGFTIWNNAGSSDIGFTINKEPREGSDEVVLKAGDSATIGFEMATISKLNIALVAGGSATIRVMGVL